MNKSILQLHIEYFKELDKKLISLHNESKRSERKFRNIIQDYSPCFIETKI